MDHELNDERKTQGGNQSSASEAIIVNVGLGENGKSGATSGSSAGNEGLEANPKESRAVNDALDCSSCVIDVNSGEDGSFEAENQRVCRICHLNSWESTSTSTSTSIDDKGLVSLIELGCSCKGELGFAHLHCAEAWFKLRGNRVCEICGDTARNITGVSDNRFMDEWYESGYTGASDNSSESRGCWRGQPLCNFLMACLVIAFVLPWFFRVNMF